MTPLVLLLGVLLAATSPVAKQRTRPRAPASVPAPSAPSEFGAPLPPILHAIESADSVVAYALGERWTEGNPHAALFGREILDIENPGDAWRRHAVQILSDVLLYQRNTPYPKLTDPGRSRYALMFCGRDTVTALWTLTEPSVEIRDREGLAGRGVPDPVRLNALVELSREAFPRDERIQKMHLLPRVHEEYGFVDSLPQVLEISMEDWSDGRTMPDSGSVLVQVRVGPDGRVHQAHLINSTIPPREANGALNVVRLARFRPAMLRGKPVSCWVMVPLEWRAKTIPH